MQPGGELRVEVPQAAMHVMMDGMMLTQARDEQGVASREWRVGSGEWGVASRESGVGSGE